jgi:hypothetical protein
VTAYFGSRYGERKVTNPVSNPAALQRRDPSEIFSPSFGPHAPSDAPEETGPLGTGVVAHGRCLHAPTGRKIIVGSRPHETSKGAIVHRDVTSSETKIFKPGDVVTLPVREIERCARSGFSALATTTAP